MKTPHKKAPGLMRPKYLVHAGVYGAPEFYDKKSLNKWLKMMARTCPDVLYTVYQVDYTRILESPKKKAYRQAYDKYLKIKAQQSKET